MTKTTTVTTILGPVHVRRLEPTDPDLARVRSLAAANVYAVAGNQAAGMVAVTPAYDDQTCGDIGLGAETLRALVPTRFRVTFGRCGSTSPLPDGTPGRHDPILTVDGVEVLSLDQTLARGGDITDFPVNIRAGDWVSKPATALVAARTHEVIRAVLTVHESDFDGVSDADRAYARYRTPDRHASAQRDLRAALRLRDQIQERINRLEAYLTATRS
ncbi:hypothetical protein ACFWNT_41845 [Streptomyces sp. NPDC058409]|uniref:hypothetical protein n=1 Tax=Streptomyces sp. NPDC058409 TaxID=3346484 RepID=UPI0036502853